jgi:hypothetical protein
VREAAIQVYTGEGDMEYLYNDLNAKLRRVARLTSLTDEAVTGTLRCELGDDLLPFAELLLEATRRLSPVSPKKVPLYRGGKLDVGAVEYLKAREGSVLVFTSFASFSTQRRTARRFVATAHAEKGKEVRVMFVLESSGRGQVGTFSNFEGESKCLLPPGSAAQIVRVVEKDGGVEITLTDLPVVRDALGLVPGLTRQDLAPGRRPGVVPVQGSKTKLHEAVERGDIAAIPSLAEAHPEFVNARDGEWRTALMVASELGRWTW